MNVRQIDPARAAALCAQWGYPRTFDLLERRHGYWMTDVPQTGIVALVPGPLEDTHWMAHVCVAPEFRGSRDHREVFVLIRWVAGLLGATRVYAPLGSTRPGWARYLQRCGGFTESSALGPYFDIPSLEEPCGE